MAASLVTDAPSQVAAAMLVLVPALWAQLQYRPYASRRFNALEAMSLLAMVLTATLSLVYLRASSSEPGAAGDAEGGAALEGLDVAVTLGLLVPNVAVVVLQALAVAQSGALERCERALEGTRAALPEMRTSRPAVAAESLDLRPSLMPKSAAGGVTGGRLMVESPLAAGSGRVRQGTSRRGFRPAKTGLDGAGGADVT